ncbi:MAG: beta-glucosidase [Anaerolineae bacterium]|nr:beta-glucosidase [Anaerolineae bacterium]
MSKTISFPPDFKWGVATSSYQIEGAAFEDGRKMSIWDTFCRTPGKVYQGENGDVACDHYHRYESDIQLMKELGVDMYRFSIAWPRILPDGTGTVNEVGLDFYERLVDSLLANGIQPWATLYHWDLPQALQDAGGWPARATVDAFVNYADVVSKRLGDRVKHWMTHNEPWCASFLSYQIGEHAPGHQKLDEAVAASHHLLLSHGRTVPVLRANSRDSKVGIVLNLAWNDPATDSEADKEAAWRMFGYQNRWFMDPVYKGQYPEDMIELYGGFPALQNGDEQEIAAPLDFLGINYYTRAVVANAPGNPPLYTTQVYPEGEYTEMHWEVHPESLYDLLKWTQERYPNVGDIYITENGAAFDDKLTEDGQVKDENRVNYLKGHFASMRQAMEEGVPLKGYFLWSMMDNFEWAYGYSKRFGIIYVDFDTQERFLKDSAKWYAMVTRANSFEF